MKMDLIQPFVNALDAVISETMDCSAQIADVTMEEGNYLRSGIAARVGIHGEIQGRVVLDMDRDAALQAAADLGGAAGAPTEETAREAVCELTNMVIGNAVTLLNDRGFRFKVQPPEIYAMEDKLAVTREIETVVLRFETPKGKVYLSIAVQYNLRRAGDPAAVHALSS
jgi:chemotaxis protein CheX